MEKNLAAFLREDTKTVGVRFIKDLFANYANYQQTLLGEDSNPIQLSIREYTYVTDIPLEVGDNVIVFAQDIPKLVIVTRVDDRLNINPKDTVEYKWVVSKVDYSNYNNNIAKNQDIKDLVIESYKKNVKNQFKDMVLAGLDAKNKKALTNILKG